MGATKPPASETGASMAAALQAKRMSQAELARQVGVTRAAISAYIRGEVTPPPKRLAKINDILGAEVEAKPKITVGRVAAAMGASPKLIRRGLRNGQLSNIGVAIPSPSGKPYRYLFYPARVKEVVGIG